jgi:hypothetical protein
MQVLAGFAGALQRPPPAACGSQAACGPAPLDCIPHRIMLLHGIKGFGKWSAKPQGLAAVVTQWSHASQLCLLVFSEMDFLVTGTIPIYAHSKLHYSQDALEEIDNLQQYVGSDSDSVLLEVLLKFLNAVFIRNHFHRELVNMFQCI